MSLYQTKQEHSGDFQSLLMTFMSKHASSVKLVKRQRTHWYKVSESVIFLDYTAIFLSIRRKWLISRRF